jgi:hypothetical protein
MSGDPSGGSLEKERCMVHRSFRAAGVWVTAAAIAAPGSVLAQQSTATTTAALTQPAVPAALAQQPPAPGPATSAVRPPVFNRANERLPAWFTLRGEFRERIEGFDGFGFNSTRDDLYWLTRLRLNAAVTPSKRLRFEVQMQDARVAKKTIGPTGTPFKAPLDLRMAFADVGATTSPFRVRVGRQELVYGEQRLIGHVGWLNAARTFDGVKATFRNKAFQTDVFATSVVRILDGEFDRSGNGNRFAGAYGATTKLIPQATVEPFVLFKRDVNLRAEAGGLGTLEEFTTGIRLVGKMPARLDYGIEMALQRGSLGTDDISAWAGHWQLRETFPGRFTPRVTGEYNFASGDEDPGDNVRGTFDQLYPTPHDKTGLADQIGWKNIHHARAGFELSPVKGMPLTTNYHSWWMAESKDAVYNIGNAVVGRVAAGAADRHVGQEIDVQVSKAITPQIQAAAGYAHIFPGAFLKETTPGASYSHPYVMVTYVFLAEK